MGYETSDMKPPTPNPAPRTPHGSYQIVSRDKVGTKFKYFLFKRCDILVS